MLAPGRLLRRVRNLLTRNRRNSELNEELQFHIDMETARQLRAGADVTTARTRALALFGNIELHRDAAGDMRGTRPVEDFVQDVQFALRTLKRHRVYAGVSVLTLAIGIGATTAIFGAVYGVLLAPLPYARVDRIVTLWQTAREGSAERGEVSPGAFLDWRERARSFSSMAAAEGFSLDIVTPRGPESLETSIVTEGFFETLGALPLRGRTFRAEEFTAGRNGVVLLSERIWRTMFGADTTLVGRALILDSVPMTVVGIMPAAVDLPSGQVAWIPKVYRPGEREDRTAAYFSVVARLRDGVTFETAAREMQGLTATLAAEQAGAGAKRRTLVVSLNDALFADARRPLYLLFGAVAFVLLIACANVANLQLANGVRRTSELAIRAALGAGRRRLMRQLFAESVVLAALGGVVGVGVAFGGINAIRRMAPADLPRFDALHLNGTMLAFSLALSMLVAVAFGMLPMLQAGGSNPGDVMGASSTRGLTATLARRQMQRLLVGAEIVLAMVLLVGAGLLARSLGTLLTMDRGFETTGVINVTLQAWGYYPTGESRATYVREVTRRLSGMPGVQAVGMTSSLPLSSAIGMERTSVVVEASPVVASSERPTVHVASATGGYFAALKIPVRSGRVFEGSDAAGAMPVAMVNDAFVRAYLGRAVPLGTHVTLGFMSRPIERTVIGVVADTRHDGLASDPEPMIYLPHAQAPTGAVQLVVRSSAPLETVQRAVRAELIAMNGSMPIAEVTSLDARLSQSLRGRRFNLALLSAFSIAALLLAAIGIYGMMMHLTGERTSEIGIRIAIGANPTSVVWLVLQQSIVLAAVSMLAGAACALALTQMMRSMLFGITALDPATYVGSGMLLFGIAVIAAWLPARRLSSIDPAAVLRAQ